MRSYLPSVADASRAAEFPVTGTPAGTVVVRAAGLRVHGRTVTVEGRAPSAGEPAVFCRPVVTAPAVVRRDGTVLADAWLPDLVRLGELEAYLGDGVIEAIVDTAVAQGRLKPRQRRRIMSYPLVIRLMIAMTPMLDASYCEALARLAGLLADIPFLLEWHVPTERVVTDWRLPVPPGLLEGLFWQAAGPLIGDDEPSAVLLAGMMGARRGRDAGEPGGYPGEPGVLRLDRDGGWFLAVPAAADRRCDRPRGPRDARGDPGPGRDRGADPAEAARKAPPGPVRRCPGTFERLYDGMIAESYPSWFGPRVLFEDKAACVHEWEMRGIPGLLQTRSYADAVIRACRPYDTEEDLDRDATARVERQNILMREDPPKLWVVLGEGVLRQAVGGVRVIREQLDHLLSLAEGQGIVLQVLPFAVSDAPGVDGPAALFEFEDSPPVAYLEGWGSGRVVKDPREVAAIATALSMIKGCALSPIDSAQLITKIRSEL